MLIARSDAVGRRVLSNERSDDPMDEGEAQ
jgi:hypothetical protein